MGVLKFHKDLRSAEGYEGIIEFVLSQFAEPHIDVTASQDTIDNVEAYHVQGLDIPERVLEVAFIRDDSVLPDEYIPFKELYKGKYQGGWK